MRKNIIKIAIIAILLSVFTAKAQQDPMFTQYMFNTLSINPAYAGSQDVLSINVISRHQWIGIEGAPKTQTLVVHTPLKHNIGVGLSVINDKIGPQSQTGLKGSFSYKLKIGKKSSLSLGIMAGVNKLDINLTDLENTESTDVAFQQNLSGIKPLFGFGIYFKLKNAYIGLSMPELVETNYENGISSWKQARHYYFIAGYIANMGKSLKFKPTVLVRYTQNAPVSAEITGQLIIKDRIWIGGMYRLKESVGGLLGIQITKQLRLGYAYDYGIGELSAYGKGAHEIMLNYNFMFKNKEYASPIYF